MLVDFKNSFNVGTRKKWLITRMKNLPPQLNFVATLPCKTNTSVNVRDSRETVEVLRRETPDFISPDLWPTNSHKQSRSQSSWLPDLGCHASAWCIPEENSHHRRTEAEANWSLVRPFKNSRLSTWLSISGAKDLELVFVRREDTSNIVFELNDCLGFVNFLSPSLSCFAWILHRWVKQHCCNGSHSH